jgi:germination protein M
MRRMTAMLMLLAMAAAGCGSSGAVDQGAITDVVSSPPGSAPATTTDPDVHQISYQVWLTRGETLWPTMRSGEATPAVGRAAIGSLLAGPSADEHTHGIGSAVPAGTRLLGLTIRDGTATVDLSSEYESGGGSLSMTMRLAQLVYTLTQFSTVKRVVFHLDGQPVTVFSGEGIALDRPQTRADYEQVLPVIAVASPGFGAEVTSPVTISGLANVFEANVTAELLDGHGKLLTRDFTIASCGTGCWGTFSLQLRFPVDSRQLGTLVVHDDDAAGTGTFPHEERIPVVLVP